MRNPFLRLFAVLLAASAMSIAVLELRTHRTGDSFYSFLTWNLFLAWVPLLVASLAYLRAKHGLSVGIVALLVLWLLFFPNAPYMLTDFIHLGTDNPAAPLWYDALMLSSFAWTALVLGFVSVYFVQTIVRRFFGGRLVVVCCRRSVLARELRRLLRALRAFQ